MKYVNVAIDNNNDNTDNLYTYGCAFDDVSVGNKVYVPFARGNRMKAAYVFSVLNELTEPVKGMKYVDHIDEEISLCEESIAVCVWMKQRYLCRYIDAVNCFTPSGTASKRGKIRTPFVDAEGESYLEKELTAEQKSAVEQIKPAIAAQAHKKFLVHGVTSSGKTEVYMRVIAECISRGRGAIVLVPEISLTKQTIERFMGRFGPERVAVLHSKLSLGERYDEWMRIKNGGADIVIGARSAIFAPLDHIGAIILDEEHETTYKSDMTPKYDTAEIAAFRAERSSGVVLLGSATPSIVSSYRAQLGQYEKVILKERYNKMPMPAVVIADMRAELLEGNRTIFSRRLYFEMKACLEQKRQIILFLNRRGYASFISCRSCGYVMKCKECGISLTYHKAEDEAVCHFCGRREKVPKLCPECGSKYMKQFGTGTEKVEEAVKQFFPESACARLDLDTIKRKGSIDKILNSFRKGKTDILIGTQLVAKGLDFENVGLVGIVAADVTLNLADFRAPERTFQLITQASGRAGRGDTPGKVVIQSYSPDHYAVTAAAENDYEGFYNREIMMRSALLYPPFSDLFQIVLSSADEETAKKTAEGAAGYFIGKAGSASADYIFGPQPSPMNKVNGFYRYQLLVKCLPENRQRYAQVIGEMKRGISLKRNSDCLISIDINPFSFL